jgi:hypothetical protein
MKLYAGTTEQFRADARMHRIAEKLRAEYTAQIGHRPAPTEVASWQNSLMALSMLVDQAELNDHGVILEYQLGKPSRRLDAMLTGHSPTSAENAVVVELKQWSDGTIGPSTADNSRKKSHPRTAVAGGSLIEACQPTTQGGTADGPERDYAEPCRAVRGFASRVGLGDCP